jgi:hypothetical protein
MNTPLGPPGHTWAAPKSTTRDVSAGQIVGMFAIRGFHLQGRAHKRWCTEIFVPEHLDGIGDFAEAALCKVAADVLAKDPAGRTRLQEVAGGGSESSS